MEIYTWKLDHSKQWCKFNGILVLMSKQACVREAFEMGAINQRAVI